MYRAPRCLLLLASLSSFWACAQDPTAAALSLAMPASENAAPRGPFSAFTYLCGQETQDFRLTDDVIHWTFVNTRRVISSTPGLTGTLVAPINVNINLRTGAGGFEGTFVWSPDGYDGTWTSHFAGHFQGAKLEGDPLTLVSSHVIAQGTGVFDGQRLMFDILFNTAFEHPDEPAGCAWDGEHYVGAVRTL